MYTRIHNHHPARPLRLLICAALACAITGVTTQVIVSSANHLEYGMAASGLAAAVQADAGLHSVLARAA
jgi:hypothetical protein